MKLIRKCHYGLIGVLAMLLAVGCQAVEPQKFMSDSGLTVTATDQWTKIQDTALLYSAEIGGESANGIDLALRDTKNHYFTIEWYDHQESLKDVVRLANQLRQQIAVLGETALTDQLVQQNVDAVTLEQYQELWQCPVGEEEQVYHAFADEAWHKEMAGLVSDYSVSMQEQMTLLNNKATLYEYSYTNEDGQKLHGYEASVIWQNKFYTFNAWTLEKQFASSQEALKAIITSVVRAAQ